MGNADRPTYLFSTYLIPYTYFWYVRYVPNGLIQFAISTYLLYDNDSRLLQNWNDGERPLFVPHSYDLHIIPTYNPLKQVVLK